MHHYYDPEVLKEIDERADLISYVEQNYELERRGDNLYMSCPKHVDLTPSLSFNIKDGFYYCFSCGRSGRMIWWLYDYEGLTYDEAVEKAAKLAEVDMNGMCQSDTVRYLKKIRRMNLPKKERCEHTILSPREIEKYKVHEVKEWEDEGIDPNVMKEFGVRIDELNNRIVYPVYDIHGNLINIKGRTRYVNYKELKLAKYINYFKIGCLDYFQCLSHNLPFIRERGEVIIFESIKSVMKAYGWGYRNAVSAETHTLSDEQIELLLSLRVNVVIAWDSDINMHDKEVVENFSLLKRMTNLYFVVDNEKLLGGKDAKNAPVDCGREIWEKLYQNKRKVV